MRFPISVVRPDTETTKNKQRTLYAPDVLQNEKPNYETDIKERG